MPLFQWLWSVARDCLFFFFKWRSAKFFLPSSSVTKNIQKIFRILHWLLLSLSYTLVLFLVMIECNLNTILKLFLLIFSCYRQQRGLMLAKITIVEFFNNRIKTDCPSRPTRFTTYPSVHFLPLTFRTLQFWIDCLHVSPFSKIKIVCIYRAHKMSTTSDSANDGQKAQDYEHLVGEVTCV